MHAQRTLTRIMVVLFALTVSGCGYQLRETAPEALGFKRLKFICNIDDSWSLCTDLRRQIIASNVTISNDAKLELNVGPFEQKERVFTIQSDGSAEEYELKHEAAFSLRQSDFPDQSYSSEVSARRIYRHNSTALLAKEREREVIEEALNQSLANEIIRQLVLLKPIREKAKIDASSPADEFDEKSADQESDNQIKTRY